LLKRSSDPRRRAEIEAELQAPPFPGAAISAWSAFHRLSTRRGSNGFGGVNPITWSEIDAFVRLSGVSLTLWDIEAIEMLDDIFRTEQAKSAKK
jgi:hypothetical protein